MRCAAVRDDHHGARSRARLHPSRRDVGIADRPGDDDADPVHDAVGHALLRAGLHVHGRARRLLLLAGAVRPKRPSAKAQLSTFLVTRGLWLMLLELTVMRLAYNFNLSTRAIRSSCWCCGARAVHDRARGAGLAADPACSRRSSVATIVLHHLADGIDARRSDGRAVVVPAAPGRRLSSSPATSSSRRIRWCRGSR